MIDGSVFFWRNRKLVTAHSPKCKVHHFAFDFIPSTLILTDDCPSVMLNRWIVIPVPIYSTEITLMHTHSQNVSISHALLQTTSFWASTQIQKPIETTEVLQDCYMPISRKNKYDLTATVMLLLHRRTVCKLMQRFVYRENFLKQFLVEDWESYRVQAMPEMSC